MEHGIVESMDRLDEVVSRHHGAAMAPPELGARRDGRKSR
jgi:hypothetical protein